MVTDTQNSVFENYKQAQRISTTSDTTLMAESEEELKSLLMRVKKPA